MRTVYNELPDSIKKHPIGKSIGRYLYPPKILETGDTLPQVTFYDLEGFPHTLAESKGKTILIVFYSAGCGGCMENFPEFDQFTENYSKNIEIFKISVDPVQIWQSSSTYFDIKGHNWNEGNQREGIFMDFDGYGVPYCVLVSTEGIILEKWITLQPTKEILSKYFD